MKKRILSLFIIIALFVSCFSVNSFAATASYNEESAITLVKTLGIMVGNQNGNMELDKNVSRAEFAKIAVVMSAYRNMVASAGTTSVFADCTFKHWASPYVRVAVTNNIITGYPDGTFRPENTVSLEEASTIMLKLLGYTNDDFAGSWPYGQMGVANNIHLTDGIDKKIGDNLKRRDVLHLVYNTLTASPKNAANPNSNYIEQLDCYLYEDAVIIATNEQNNSVTPGYVLTSAGTFKLHGEFDSDLIGRKGDLIIENGNDYAGFMPVNQIAEKHTVYSKLSDTIVTQYNGKMTNFTIDSNVTAYLDTSKTTYGSVKNSISTGDTIYLMKDSGGNVDYITVATNNMQGPYTVGASTWYKMFAEDSDSLTVMRNGVKADVNSVEVNDIVYYLSDSNTVFAYSKKITGVYEKATPNRDTPTSITVSGTEYVLESAAAFNKVSSSGDFKIGDTITLLLGKNGQVADVMDTQSASSVSGYLVNTGSKQFTNSDGEIYSSVYATLVCADGSTLEVITKNDYSSYINKVMSVNFNSGVASLTVSKAGGTVYGNVDSTALTIGSSKISEGVNILDVTTNDSSDSAGSYVKTYIQRLDGIYLNSKDVLYVKKDKNGYVTDLILNDVTGDAYEYGVITNVTESGSNEGMSVASKRYSCDILGTIYTCSNNYGNTFKKGIAATFLVSGNSVSEIKALNMYSGVVKSVNEGTVTVSSNTYLTSDKVAVYKVTSSGSTLSAYTILPLSELKENISNYSVTAYYDKTQDKGGRVRVILAKEK